MPRPFKASPNVARPRPSEGELSSRRRSPTRSARCRARSRRRCRAPDHRGHWRRQPESRRPIRSLLSIVPHAWNDHRNRLAQDRSARIRLGSEPVPRSERWAHQGRGVPRSTSTNCRSFRMVGTIARIVLAAGHSGEASCEHIPCEGGGGSTSTHRQSFRMVGTIARIALAAEAFRRSERRTHAFRWRRAFDTTNGR